MFIERWLPVCESDAGDVHGGCKTADRRNRGLFPEGSRNIPARRRQEGVRRASNGPAGGDTRSTICGHTTRQCALCILPHRNRRQLFELFRLSLGRCYSDRQHFRATCCSTDGSCDPHRQSRRCRRSVFNATCTASGDESLNPDPHVDGTRTRREDLYRIEIELLNLRTYREERGHPQDDVS